MHPSLNGISEKILELALAARTRANTDAVYFDRNKEHTQMLAPLAAVHAGELLLKALIANSVEKLLLI